MALYLYELEAKSLVAFIARWRKKAIALFGKSRGLNKTQRDKVTSLIRGGGTSKPRAASNPKKKVKKTTKKKSKGSRRGGRKVLGNMGLKGILVSTLGLVGLKFLIKKTLPVPDRYIDGAACIGTGLAGKVFKLPTKNLLPTGVVLTASNLIDDFLVAPVAGRGAFVGGGYDV